jgi:hypothetical protein
MTSGVMFLARRSAVAWNHSHCLLAREEKTPLLFRLSIGCPPVCS